jgi:hypothetical protein
MRSIAYVVLAFLLTLLLMQVSAAKQTEVWCFDPQWVASTEPGDYAVSTARCELPNGTHVVVKWID